MDFMEIRLACLKVAASLDIPPGEVERMAGQFLVFVGVPSAYPSSAANAINEVGSERDPAEALNS